MRRPATMRRLRSALAGLVPLMLAVRVGAAASVDVTVRVLDAQRRPLEGASVRSGDVHAVSDASGVARLQVASGRQRFTILRIGYAADTLRVLIARDTTLLATLHEADLEVEPVVISSTRSDRRIEDEPERVEVLAGDEPAEKSLQHPADLRNVVAELPGVRVQTASSTTASSGLRLQGLRAQYSAVLLDGLPLMGSGGPGLGLLQLTPIDLQQAEVIKGAATALYGPSAAGGVLATYYWFSQTPLYNDTILVDLPWYTLLRWLMATLAFLMISNVPYPAWPTFSLRTLRGGIGLVLFVGLGFGLIFLPKEFFFPVGISYVLFGVLAAVLRGLTERQPGTPEPHGEEFQEDLDEDDYVATLADELEDVEFDDPPPRTSPERTHKPRTRPQPKREPKPQPQGQPQPRPAAAPDAERADDGEDGESSPPSEHSKRRRRRRRRPRGGPRTPDQNTSEDSPE